MIYYVEDSDTRFMRVTAGKMSAKSLDAIVDTVALNKIGTFITEVCLQRANFISKTRDSYYTVSPSEKYLHEDNNVIANFKALTDLGIDSNSYLLEETKKRGISGWISVRMNDIHSGEDDDSPLHTSFWREHPEYRISNTPYENGLDFSHAEVREHVLSFIEEVIERYEIDGIILDWMRFPTYFRHREAWLKHEYLTEIMEKAANMVRKKSARIGHNIVLAVRVPLLPEISKEIGLDVETWTRRGLVDRVFISGFVNAQSYDAPVEEWRKLIDVPVTVSLEGWHRPHISAVAVGMDGEALNGAAYAALARGSDGVMVYNMMELSSKAMEDVEAIDEMPDSYCDCPDAKRNCLSVLDNYDVLASLTRKYYLAWQDMKLTISEQDRVVRLHEKPALTFELPALLAPGASRCFTFFTGPINGASIVADFLTASQKEGLRTEIKHTADTVFVTICNPTESPVTIESVFVTMN